MKRLTYYLAAVFALTMSACNEYLDEMPDNRTELDSKDKITKLLVAAYPSTTFAELAELSSDNTDHISGNWTTASLTQDQASLWQDVTDTDNDSPYALWNSSYSAIAAANAVLQGIEKLGNPQDMQSQRGEALLCRAYNHFVLVNIFCRAYSPKTSDKDLGIPYMTDLETSVLPSYSRGTVREVYEKIEQDLLQGLSLVSDEGSKVPKYHFNRKSALAFAARFYLYYVQPDKSNYRHVIDYATEVLTNRPSTMLRDWKTVGALSPSQGIRANGFVSADEKANLLLCVYNSMWARTHGSFQLGDKYCHGKQIATYETVNASGTDPVNHIGIPHVIMPAFTTDELLINRAEAYAMTGDFAHAESDLTTWSKAFCRQSEAVTDATLQNTYGKLKYYTPTEPTAKKELHPDFAIESGTQENLIHAILHTRRLLCLHEGLRWFDVKRFGITIYRRTCNADNSITVDDQMTKDDPRQALQLPQSVITAGLEANPRN